MHDQATATSSKLNPAGWFAAFVVLPVVITGPGQYVTRSGEVVTVAQASSRHAFECRGAYSDGVSEAWHKSGRLLFGSETANDIVRAA